MAVKRLTETGVERISPPSSGRIEISDELLTGLMLRVTSNGVKSWYFVYRLGGKQRRMLLGHYPEITLRNARDIVRAGREQIAFGEDPFTTRQEKIYKQISTEAKGVTIEKLSQEFIERHSKPNNRTWKETQQLFENHINPMLGNRVAAELRRRDIIAVLDEMVAEKRSSAANHVLVALRKMYNWSIERDILEANPCTGIKKPVLIRERERVLNRDEIRSLWNAAEEIGYPYGSVLQLLLLTGQRRSEIATLKWSYIDFDRGVISLPAENVKAKRGHEVPLSNLAIDILQSLPRFQGLYVFTTTHGERPIGNFGKEKIGMNQKVGIDNWRIHDLRRTCATGMAELGVHLPTISRVLNHAEGGVTRIYARYSYLNEKRDALNTWSDHLRDLIKGDGGDSANIVPFRKAK